MTLSIITVNLNNRDGLLKTIGSVVSQNFKDFEWIVIDGGSTDGSPELIKEYSSHFSYWISEPDKGIYNAMNKGLAYANGDYCLFLNSGDRLASSDVLGKVVPLLDGDDIIYGNWEELLPDHPATFIQSPTRLSLRFFYKSNICHQASFIKRSLLRDKGYDESLRIIADWEFNIRQAIGNRSFKYIPVTVCVFSQDGISSTRQDVVEAEKEYLHKRFFPSLFYEDYCQSEEAETHLAHTSLEEFNTLCKSHGILSKMITAIVCLMKKI